MKQKKFKFLKIFIAIILLFQNLDTSFANTTQTYELPDKDILNLNDNLSKEFNKEIQKQLEKDVRVIVELQGEPVIQEAINKGISYVDLTKKEIENSEKKIELEQKAALDDLKSTLPNSKENLENKKKLKENEILNYDTSFNGIAVTVKEEDIQTIKNKPYVKNVYISQEYERPQMKHSNNTIGSHYAWDTKGYKGEGIVVAIIDSGLDYRHMAMTIDDSSKAKHNEDSINSIIRENNLKGRYFTDKVPYGYNYYDHNQNTLDSYGFMHGMHVAGTVGANSSKGAKIDGVAPNVQLLALKVFSDDLQYPTTFTDVWLKAIDDAITLKADVINMSLGSAAGLASSDRPEDIALQRAKDAGIVVAIAAGNDANLMNGYYYKDKSNIKNPDTSLIASPSLLNDSISVASIENKVKYVNKLHWNDNFANINLNMNNNPSLSAMAVNLGNAEEDDYKGKDVKNKIVLIQKTQPKPDEHEEHQSLNTIDKTQHTTMPILNLALNNSTEKLKLTTSSILSMNEKDKHKKPLTLTEKIHLAQDKKAAAIIIYNDEKSGENLGRNLNYSSPITSLPIGIIGYKAGKKLIEDLNKNPGIILNLNDKLEEEPNLSQGEVSFFSSWGPTPDLRIKPEVSAPGGYIYSTIEDDKYQNMSGTSMASPHVAGASAILKQYLNEKGINDKQSVDFIKLLLMNTALPMENSQKKIDFVRRQGAGIIQLDKALMTEVTVKATGTNDDIQDGKLELKELSQSNFNFTLNLKNNSKNYKKYKISALGIYEIVENEQLSEKAENIENFGNLNEEITISPNSQKEFNYNIDFGNYPQIRKDSFIEGYIKLEDLDKEDAVDLTIPFLAYYGDWGKPKAIDAFEIKEVNENEKRTPQIAINKDDNAYGSLFFSIHGLRLPVVNDTLYFYPDTYRINKNNYYPWIAVRLAPLRNINKIRYSILDEETGEVLKVLGESQEVRKVSRLDSKAPYKVMPDSIWDGIIDGKEVTEKDKLIYQMEVTLNNHIDKNPTTQIYQYKLRVDKQNPILEDNIKITNAIANVKKVDFFVQDTGSGINSVYLQSVYFKRRFPSTAPGEKPNPKDDEPVDPKEIGDNPDLRKWKIQYGKFQRIVFADSKNIKSSKLIEKNTKILKIKDGVLSIPESMAKESSIICDINGHENKIIKIETHYEVDQPYLEIAVGDNLTNKTRKIINTGYQKKSYKLTFLNYSNNIKPYDAKLTINGKNVMYDTSLSEDAKIKIEFPKKNAKLVFLKLGFGKYHEILIEKGKVNPQYKDKYEVEIIDDFTYTFKIKDNKKNIDITTTTQKIVSDNENLKLSFEDIDFSKIQILSVGKQFLGKDKKVLKLKKGTVEIWGGLNQGVDEKIDSIFLEYESKEIKKLERAKDYAQYRARYSKDIYYFDEKFGDLEIKLDLKENSKLKINLKKESQNLENTTNSNSNSQKNNSKHKYPVIFLRKPDLLELKTEKNIDTNGITIDGFVGYVDENGLESINISLVDEKGNVIGKKYEVSKDSIKKKDIDYNIGTRKLYSGKGYEFTFDLKYNLFNTNIKIEAIAKNGQKSSIVRRLFYDEEFPKLAYEILPRHLSDENMQLFINASDNSYKIKLYKNDSYLDGIDLSKKTLEQGNVNYSKKWNIKLKLGQNKIVLKAIDATGHESSKTLYVYRSMK